MTTVLGLLGIVIYIAAVVSVAAAVTWLVVRLTPTAKKKPAPEQAESPPAS